MDLHTITWKLKEGNQEVFKDLYKTFKSDFIDWAMFNFNLDEDEATDIFQESITTLYLNVYAEKIQCFNATVKTYIFAIGKRHIYKRYHQTRNVELHGSIPDCIDETMDIIDVNFYNDDKALNIANRIHEIAEPCRSLLEYVYLKNYAYEVIVAELGYKNIKVLKAKKWRCLKQLRRKMGC